MARKLRPIKCAGPLVWFDVDTFMCRLCAFKHAACIILCSVCGYVVTSGNYHDDAHADTDMIHSPK